MTAAASRIGLGCSRMGSFNNPASPRDSAALIARALELGVTVFDTANIYGQGDSERILGRALRGRPDAARVMTKIGKRFSAKMRLLRPFKPLIKPLVRGEVSRQAMVATRLASMDPDFLRSGYEAALDQSLRRLGMDRVDTLYLHSPPIDVIRDPAPIAELRALAGKGKIARWGISVDHVDELRAALALDGLGVLQIPYDIIRGHPDLAEAARARGVEIVAREVIGAQPGLAPRDAVAAAAHDPLVDITLVGTTSPAHLEAAVAAAR